MYEQPNQHKTSRIVNTLITAAVIAIVAFILWWLYQSFFSTQPKTNTNSTNQTAGITMSDKDFTAKLESAIRDLGYDDKYVKLNTANWATTPQQGNILISGSVTANSFIGNGSSLTNLNANNVTSGTISTNLLPGSGSITCPSGVGNLTGGGNQATLGGAACGAISIITNPTFSLVTSTNIATNNLNTITLASNSISSTNINSTNLSSANLTTTNLNAQTIATNNLNTNAITATSATINGNATVTGSLTANTVTATSLAGDGLALTNLNADNIASGTLAVSQGGTGANSFILNGLLYGDGTNPIKSLAPGNSSQCLVTTTSGGAPQWGSCSAGGGVTAPNPGTNNTIAMFTGTNTIANSLLSQDVGATTVTANGSLQVNGNANITGTMVGASTIQGASLISTVTTGTAPLQVTSTTKVANLNADLLDGYTASDFAQASSLGNYVLKAGDTMSGNLNMGTNKLIGGTGVTDVLKLQGTTGNGTSTSPAIQLLTGNNGATTALTVLNNGNVGIGTTTPNSKLHVSTGNDSNSGEIAIAIGGTANNNARQAQIVKNTSANYELKIISGMNAVNGSALTFETSPGTEKMRLTGSGEFGIGTNNPTAKLQVDSTTTTLVGAIIKATAAQTADMLQIRNSSGTVMSAFDSAGKLAINTTSTSSALTVKGTSSVATVGTSNILTADGTFATDSGWTLGADWSIAGGVATSDALGTTTLSGTSSATSTSTVYQVNFTVAQTTAGSGFSVSLGGNDSGTTINTAGAKTLYIRPTNATGTLVFTPLGTGNWEGSIDDVTIYAVTTSTADMVVQGSNGAGSALEVRQGGSGQGSYYLGTLAGSNSLTTNNTAIGFQAMRYTTTGTNNTALGRETLALNTMGQNNNAIGYQALFNNTNGSNNDALGYHALRGNTTGSLNVAVGLQALMGNTTGVGNIAVGYNSLYLNTTGNYNTSLGYGVLTNNGTNSYNVGVGFAAFNSLTTGGNNTAIGNDAGRYHTSATALTSASNSVFLGNLTRASANGNTNEIVIGSSAIGNGSNSVTLGNTSITKTILQGNVGIGTTSPAARLDVLGGVASGLNDTIWLSGGAAAYNSGPRMVFHQQFGTNSYPNWRLGEIGSIYTTGATFSGALVFNVNKGTTATDIVEGMRLTYNSRLGINETAPGAQLQVTSGAAATIGQIIKGAASQTADLLQVQNSAGTSLVNVTAGGNVGMGNPAPTEKLVIQDTTVVSVRVGSAQNNIRFQRTAGPAGTSTIGYSSGGNTGLFNGLIFSSYDGSVWRNNMYIADTGNVGIGTTSPTDKLTLFSTGDTGISVKGDLSSYIYLNGADYGLHRPYGAANLEVRSASRILFKTGTAGANEIMRINSDGNVGIGTTSPATKLEVVGGVDGAEADVLTLKSNFTATGTATTLRFVNSTVSTNDTVSSEISSIRQSNGADLVLRTGDGVNMQSRLYVQGNTGNVGIGTTSPSYLLHVGSSSTTAGTAVAHFQNADGTCTINPSISGSVSCTSDERLKKDITKLDTTTTLDKLLGISTISYHMNNDTNDSPLKVGFSAQQLETILPDLVVTNADGYKSVSYAGLTPYLVAGLQAQQQTINSLKQDIQTLQAATGINSNQVTIANLNVSGPTTLTDLTVNGNLNVTGNLTLAGTLTVKDLTLTNNLTINGHIITAGNTPTITPLPAAGQGATATIEGNDTSGKIVISTGDTPISGDLVKINFSNDFGKLPKIVATPQDGTTAMIQPYATPELTSFTVGAAAQLEPNQTYIFSYLAIE